MLRVKNPEAVVSARLPYAEILYQITDSKLLTTLLVVWVTIVLFSTFLEVSLRTLSNTLSCDDWPVGHLWSFGMGSR